MPPVAPLCPQPHFAERQIEIIEDYQHIFFGNLLLLQPKTDCFTAAIHIGRRLEQQECAPLPLTLSDIPQLVGTPIGRQLSRQFIDSQKTYIMPSVGVLSTDVTQTYDQIFHSENR